MSKYIIIQQVDMNELHRGIMELDDLVLCDQEGEMKHFSSKKRAKTYLRQQEVSGQIIRLNLDKKEVDGSGI